MRLKDPLASILRLPYRLGTPHRNRLFALPTSGVIRKRLLSGSRSIGTVSLIFLFALVTAARSANGHIDGTAAVRDLAIKKRSDGQCTVFVVDGSQRLLQKGFRCDAPEISYADLEEVRLNGPALPPRISAVAISGDTLYLTGRQVQSVFAVNIGSLETGIAARSSRLASPGSIAVTKSGFIIIGQDDPDNVLIFDPRKPDSEPVELKLPSEKDLYRIVAIGDDLLIFDRDKESGGLYFCRRTSSADEPLAFEVRRVILDEAHQRLFDRTSEASRDAALSGGFLYLSSEDSIRAWKIDNAFDAPAANNQSRIPSADRLENTTIRLDERSTPFLGQGYSSKFHRLFGSEEMLASADDQRKRINLYRLRPYKLSGPSEKTNSILVSLLSTAYRLGVLPEREITSSRDFKSFAELLIDERTFLPDERKTLPAGIDPAGSSVLSTLLCGLNRRLNNWGCDESKPYPVSETLSRRIDKGQALVIPELKYAETPDATQLVQLNGSTVQSVLEGRFKDPQHLSSFTDEYLMRNVAKYLSTLDYEMTQRGLILRTRPGPAEPGKWEPGSFISIDETGYESPGPGKLGCADAEIVKELDNTGIRSLSRLMASYDDGFDYLPGARLSAEERDEMRADFRKLGIRSIEVQFEQPSLTKIPRNSLRSPEVQACLASSGSAKSLIAADVLRVKGVSYRLRTASGGLHVPNEGQKKKWKLFGETDATREWSLVVNSPLVIAYRPLVWDGTSSLTTSPNESQQLMSQTSLGPDKDIRWAPTVASIKPGSTQDIRSKRDGNIRLPVIAGDVNFSIDPRFAAIEKAVQDLAAEFPEYLTTPRPARTTAASFEPLGANLREDCDSVKANRAQLFKAISYPEHLKYRRSPEVVIGLFEAGIDVKHPDFFLDSGIAEEDMDKPGTTETIWSDGDVLNPNRRVRFNTSEKALLKAPAATSAETDHGTHLAGLLASNNPDVPGLSPSSPIVHINTTDEKWSTRRVGDAAALRAVVFNFSQTLPSDAAHAGYMRKQIKEYPDRLFVVAAGNGDVLGNALNLNESIIPAQVQWSEQTNNVLVVSATDFDGGLLTGIKNCGGKSPRVNFGWRYVHMLAPGCNIYSSIMDSGYAPDSGTSQAAAVVSGIAALMNKKKTISPQEIIARLIYTADWSPGYEGIALGGRLNAGRALDNMDKNVLVLEKKETHLFDTFVTSSNLEVKNNEVDAEYLGSGNSDLPPLKSIVFEDILRLTLDTDSKRYRIVYVDKRNPKDPRLLILKNAIVGGTIRFYGPEKTETKSISSIVDYVRGNPTIPLNVRFR